MAYHMAAMAGLGAAQGMMGGKQAAEASQQPTSTWYTPSEELGGYGQLQDYQSNFNQFSDPNMVMGNYQQFMNKALGGGGGGGAPGGGLNMKKFSKMLGNWMPQEDEYTKRVRAAEYMDFAQDPMYQARLQATQQENQESFEQQLGQNLSSFGGGGDMGMSGARMMSQNRLQDQSEENLMSQLAQMDAAERGMRGQEAMGANQAYQQLRGQGMGVLGQTKAASMQAAAQKYAANQAAGASRYGSGLQAALGGLMIPSNLAAQQLGAGSDFMHDWSTQNTQGPEMDKGKAMLGGAAGGAMSGMGMGGMMGGGKGGGGNPSGGGANILHAAANQAGSPFGIMAGPWG